MASKEIVYKKDQVLSNTELQSVEEMRVVHSFRKYFEEQIKPIWLYAQLLDGYIAGYKQAMEDNFMAKAKKAVKKPTKKVTKK